MNKLFAAVIAVVFLISGAVAGESDWNAVVKIFAVSSRPNYDMPWQNYPQQESGASGFVISGNRIITNAHAVAYPTFITVRKVGDQTRYPARVVSVNHECDLAILAVDAPGFFDQIKPMELADLPPLQSSVAVIGYPIGGDNLSVTSGVLSRIEPLRYSHSGKVLLAAQVDAAINPGNSGGPALHEGKVVGVAFQGRTSAQNIGYIIPCSVLRHFLTDLEHGKLEGFPDVPFRFQSMENPELRASFKLPADRSGVLVIERPELLKLEIPLEVGDIVMAVDGQPIANDATIDLGRGKVLFFGCLFWEKQLGAPCKFTVWRNGGETELSGVTVKFPYRVINQVFDVDPSYYMAGGVVFTPLSMNYLDTWENFSNIPIELAVNLGESREVGVDELVVVSMILADEINLGYQRINASLVSEVNGVKITGLRQLANIIDTQKEGFLDIRLRNRGRIVLDINQVRQATPRVMSRYRIARDRSEDLISPLVRK